MGEDKGEKLLGTLSWMSLFATLCVVVLTVLQMNGIIGIPGFGEYLWLELMIFMGLVLWGWRFAVNSRRYPDYRKYSMAAFLFAAVQLIFLLSAVY